MSKEKPVSPSGSLNDDYSYSSNRMIDMNIRSKEMLIAITENDLEKIDQIIKEGGINFQDKDGNSLLHLAVENSESKTIEFLLNKGAIINIKNNKEKTPIDIAKFIQRQDIIEVLEQWSIKHQVQLSSKESFDEKLNTKTDQIVITKNETLNRMLIKDQGKEIRSKNKIESFHSNIYQLKILMLFMYRGISHKYSFHLDREVNKTKTYDNIVFKYSQSGKQIYRFLQVKHQLVNFNKITIHDLFTENSDYSLMKNFFSYHNFRQEKQYNGGLIKDITVCTNINFDFESLNGAQIDVEKIKEKDNIIDIKSATKESTRYKFNEGICSTLKPKLQKYIEDKHLSVTILDNEIKDFLNHFVFVVNQPNEEEIGKIIEKEIGKEYDFITTENEFNKLISTISSWLQNKEKNVFISHKQGNTFFEHIKRVIPIWFNVRDAIKSFTGRTEEINHLHKLLKGGVNIGKPQTVCLSGLGGIGKTELARKYIDTYSKTYDNKIIWINAENYKSIVLSFRKLASEKLKISSKNADGEEKEISVIIEDVYNFFSTGKSLFVFDNAEKYKSENEFDYGISKFLPLLLVSCNRPYILITSRNQEWPNSIQVLNLSVYRVKEAIDFLTKSLNLNDDSQKEHIQELAKCLEFFPLVLQQAVAYIRMQKQNNTGLSFNIIDYVKTLTEDKTTEILNFDLPDNSHNSYIQTILSTWNTTLNVMKQEESGNDAMEILNVLAYFVPESIPRKLILGLVNNETKLELALNLLEQYSVVRVEHAQLCLHRMVQQITRIQLKKKNKEQEVLAKALKLFSKVNVTSETLDHATSVWNYSIKYNKLIEKFTSVSNYISVELMNNARYEEAYLFGLKVSELLSNPTFNDNPHILENLYALKYNIATTLLIQGKYDLALKDYMQLHALDEIIHILHPDQLDNFRVKNQIALVLIRQKRYYDYSSVQKY